MYDQKDAKTQAGHYKMWDGWVEIFWQSFSPWRSSCQDRLMQCSSAAFYMLQRGFPVLLGGPRVPKSQDFSSRWDYISIGTSWTTLCYKVSWSLHLVHGHDLSACIQSSASLGSRADKLSWLHHDIIWPHRIVSTPKKAMSIDFAKFHNYTRKKNAIYMQHQPPLGLTEKRSVASVAGVIDRVPFISLLHSNENTSEDIGRI